MAPRKYPSKKPAAPKPAPALKSPPPAPEIEFMSRVEFDHALERLIRAGERLIGDGDDNHWDLVVLHLERARTPLRKMMTDRERERVR